MITQLRSTKQVSTDIMNPEVKNTIYCQIDLFLLDENGIRVNGKYLYKTEVPVSEGTAEGTLPTFTETIVRQFSKEFSNEDANALFAALNLKHADTTSYIERRMMELNAGLHYVVNQELMFGLTGEDWE